MPQTVKFSISTLSTPKDMRAGARLMAASDPWRKLGLSDRQCLKALKVPFRITYAAYSKGRIAGLVTVAMYGTFKGYIQSLFVAEEFRGSGLGARLLGFAEKKIFASSPNVFLCVSSFNIGARRFYRRLGYEQAGKLKDFVVKGSDEFLMRKTRGPLQGYSATKRNV